LVLALALFLSVGAASADPEVLNTNRDVFDSADYTDNDGTEDWAGNWIETGDNASAASGTIQITGGELRFGGSGATGDHLRRAVNANMAIAQYATLTFEYRTAGDLDYNDELAVEVSTDGGTNYTTLEIFHEDNTGSRIYTINEFISATTVIRFRVNANLTTSGEYYFLDNVTVNYDTTAQKTYLDAGWEGGILGDNNNRSSPAQTCSEPSVHYFTIHDRFTVTDLNVGINATHNDRGDLRVTVSSPANTISEIVSTSSDTNDNYDLVVDDDSGSALNDGGLDDVGETYYDRTAGPSANGALDVFDTESAQGVWKVVVCDTNQTGGSRQGMSNHVTLFFSGTDLPAEPPPAGETSGPVVNTFYVPFPEDQVKLMQDTVYPHDGPSVPSACASTNDTSQTYNTNPKDPVITRTGVSILYDDTVLYYDQYEDGYEIDISTRNQQSTEHWGDGDLTNGVAPIAGGQFDADDILQRGDVVVTADVVQTQFLGTYFEYDARDKIGATFPVAATHLTWAAGSSTLFAGALEMYPTNRWGLNFELPVGEDKNINDMFEYTGVSVMASEDGTTVNIDTDNNGVVDISQPLNEGESYQVNGGMNAGATISADEPISVGMITADECAFFEARMFALIPRDQWDDSYFVPVGTKQAGSGNILDDVPTYAHIYNPNPFSIEVDWETQGPAAQTQFTVNPGDRVNQTIPYGSGAHFFSLSAGAQGNVRDEFSTQAYNNNDGTDVWATSWDETGDDDLATSGDIWVNDTFDVLEFRNQPNADDSIVRSVNLSTATSATFSYDWVEGAGSNSNDTMVVEVREGGAGAWTTLQTIQGDDGSGSSSHNITAFTTNPTEIRFRLDDDLEAGETYRFDNVNIAFTEPGAGGDPPDFNVVFTVDSDAGGTDPNRNDTSDWGDSAIPESQMTATLLSSIGNGYDPEYVGAALNNSSPLYVTVWNSGNPELTTDVCFDYNADGGAFTDVGTGFEYDELFTITDLDSFVAYDDSDGDDDPDTNDLDQSGMFVFVCGGDSGIITANWGQDPDRAFPGRPAIDVGTGIPNLVPFTIGKIADLAVDLNGNGLYDYGDTIEWEITVTNSGANTIPANTLVTTDEVPDNTTYVPGTTEYEQPDTTVTGIADGPGSTLPVSTLNGGFTYPHALAVGDSFYIRFQTTINAPLDPPEDFNSILNEARVTDGVFRLEADAEVPLQEPQLGAIGNYVWFDEDGDGDQDAGEYGIPNVTVELWQDTDGDGSYDFLVATTYTDAEGGYLFPGLDAGEYQVRVISSTLPDPDGAGPGGLHQTYDEDDDTGPFVTAHTTDVTLGSGVEHLTADFGYNWAPATDTNSPGTGELGAIGDRVWYDTDADGAQDVGELGIAGVPMTLYYDSNNDGVVDAIWPVDTGNGPGVAITDSNGFYIFDQLPAGIYEVVANGGLPVAGTVQTGDPDDYGSPCTLCDNRTTTPIVLGPGDVFLMADFGYDLVAETFEIGNLVFFDANADGNYDANGQDGLPGTTADNEFGIAGVSVSLIRDNGDGIYNPADDPIVATTITDGDGLYLFEGLPAGTQYFVWVDDSENVILTDLEQTSEPGGVDNGVPCVACDDMSPTVVLVGPDNLFQDFGYTPEGHLTARGLIGDTVFMDYNNSGFPDAGEGIEGVVVELYDATGATKLAQTVTDENGNYYFGDLDPTATYQVQVVTSTLPGGGTSLDNTVDPDGGNDSRSTVDLSAAPNGIDLDQDFGYLGDDVAAGSIGDLVWYDINADGNVDPGEPGISGVTVDLYEDINNNGILDNGDRLVGQTTTNGGGAYLFDDLPPGNYLVDVTDDAGVLTGMWHSLGLPATNDNSQVDAHAVALGPNEDYLAADFGYYKDPAAIGNRVWLDVNQNGIQDPGENGLPGVTVSLEITYPNGDIVLLTTVTDATGWYSFGNLLMDEDEDGVGTYATPGVGGGNESFFDIFIDVNQPALAGYLASPIQQGGNPRLDSNNPLGTQGITQQGSTNVDPQANPNDETSNASYDFGWYLDPTAISLSELSATQQSGTAIMLAAALGILLGVTAAVLRNSRKETDAA